MHVMLSLLVCLHRHYWRFTIPQSSERTIHKKLVFLHIPKTGGESIEAWMSQSHVDGRAFNHPPGNCPSTMRNPKGTWFGSTSQTHCVRNFEAAANSSKVEGFCIIRDPYERALSVYNHRFSQHYSSANSTCNRVHLSYQLKKMLSHGDPDNYDRPQVEFARFCAHTLCFAGSSASLARSKSTPGCCQGARPSSSFITGNRIGHSIQPRPPPTMEPLAEPASSGCKWCSALQLEFSHFLARARVLPDSWLTDQNVTELTSRTFPQEKMILPSHRHGAHKNCGVTDLDEQTHALLRERYREDARLLNTHGCAHAPEE